MANIIIYPTGSTLNTNPHIIFSGSGINYTIEIDTAGDLVFKSSLNDENITEIILSREGSLQEAAARLYDAMHELDTKNLDIIIAERFVEFGLGKSINDRLQRATFK